MLVLENDHLRDYSLTQIQLIIDKSKKYSLLGLLRNYSRKIFKNSSCQNFKRLNSLMTEAVIIQKPVHFSEDSFSQIQKLGNYKDFMLIRKVENNPCICAITIEKAGKTT